MVALLGHAHFNTIGCKNFIPKDLAMTLSRNYDKEQKKILKAYNRCSRNYGVFYRPEYHSGTQCLRNY